MINNGPSQAWLSAKSIPSTANAIKPLMEDNNQQEPAKIDLIKSPRFFNTAEKNCLAALIKANEDTLTKKAKLKSDKFQQSLIRHIGPDQQVQYRAKEKTAVSAGEFGKLKRSRFVFSLTGESQVDICKEDLLEKIIRRIPKVNEQKFIIEKYLPGQYATTKKLIRIDEKEFLPGSVIQSV